MFLKISNKKPPSLVMYPKETNVKHTIPCTHIRIRLKSKHKQIVPDFSRTLFSYFSLCCLIDYFSKQICSKLHALVSNSDSPMVFVSPVIPPLGELAKVCLYWNRHKILVKPDCWQQAHRTVLLSVRSHFLFPLTLYSSIWHISWVECYLSHVVLFRKV